MENEHTVIEKKECSREVLIGGNECSDLDFYSFKDELSTYMMNFSLNMLIKVEKIR